MDIITYFPYATCDLIDEVGFDCFGCGCDIETTSTTSSSTTRPKYIFDIEQCDGTMYCNIETEIECEMAAQLLGHSDTRANLFDTTDKVAGCSINNGGGLRFNENLDSSFVHAIWGEQKVICTRC